MGDSQSPSALLNPRRRSSISTAPPSLEWCFDVSFSPRYCLRCPRSSSTMGAPQSPSQRWLQRLYFIPDSLHPSPFGAAQPGWAALRHGHSSIAVSAPRPGFAPLNFILYFIITIGTPLAHLAYDIRRSSFPGGATPSPLNS